MNIKKFFIFNFVLFVCVYIVFDNFFFCYNRLFLTKIKKKKKL